MNEPRKDMERRRSMRYKRSIDCSRPKGFSQKNYCRRQKRGGRYAESKTFRDWLEQKP